MPTNMNEPLTIVRLVVGHLSANCWIVGRPDTREGLVIDPGGNSEEIIQTIKELDLDIQMIILTHGHSDHIAALYEIQESTEAAVAIHTADTDFLEGRGSFSSQFGISYRTPESPDRLLHDGNMSVCHCHGYRIPASPRGRVTISPRVQESFCSSRISVNWPEN